METYLYLFVLKIENVPQTETETEPWCALAMGSSRRISQPHLWIIFPSEPFYQV